MALLLRSGRTPDGSPVVSGCFRFAETKGLDLATIFALLRAGGCYPDIRATAREMVLAGMTPERIHAVINAALADAYGPPPWTLPDWEM